MFINVQKSIKQWWHLSTLTHHISLRMWSPKSLVERSWVYSGGIRTFSTLIAFLKPHLFLPLSLPFLLSYSLSSPSLPHHCGTLRTAASPTPVSEWHSEAGGRHTGHYPHGGLCCRSDGGGGGGRKGQAGVTHTAVRRVQNEWFLWAKTD